MPPRGRDGKKERPKDARGALRRVFDYAMEYRRTLLFAAVLCLISNSLALFGPSLAGKAINEAAAGPGRVNFDRVYSYALRMLVFYVTSALLSYAIAVIMMRVGRLLGKKMREDVFNKLMRMPVGYFDRNQAGDIISRVSYDIDVICTSFSTDLVQIASSLVA